MSKDEIDDKNKGDALFKIIALVQAIWFFIQIVVRLSYHIPTSQLEILVFSFAICTALTYGLLLDKPQDASTVVTISAARYPTPQKIIRIAIAGPYTWGQYRHSIWIPNNTFHRDSKRPMGPMATMNQGSVLALVIFEAVHCVAWDFNFPTQMQKVLWRVCSLTTVAAIPLGMGISSLILVISRLTGRSEGRSMKVKNITSIVFATVVFVFVVCRLFIIVEVFCSLAALPSEAIRSTWSANLPHIG